MKKLFFLTVLLLTFVFGCGASDDMISQEDFGSNNDSEIRYMTFGTTTSRLMIYEGDLNISADDINETFNDIIGLLENDEWIVSQSINEDYARLSLKIEASRLNDFIAQLREDFDVSSVDISAEDITQIYQDTESEIMTYEAEKTRLLELYEEASLTDMITINTRLSEIDQALNRLQNDQEERDTDIQFSTLDISIRQNHVFDEMPFSEELGNAFNSGWNALIEFFQGLIIVVVVLIPWLIIIAPVSVLGVVLFKKLRKSQTVKPTKEEKN